MSETNVAVDLIETSTVPEAVSPTPLASLMPAQNQVAFGGRQTVSVFSGAEQELVALCTAVGIYDQGWRTCLRITGEDRVRWLNGMVTNTVRDLEPGQWNYTFLLNAQGRIQGDGDVYALPESLLFATEQAQALRLSEHLDHFIIMDDVMLESARDMTAIGLAGPGAPAILAGLNADFASLPPGWFRHQGPLSAVCERPNRYTLWVPDADALALWDQLRGAGAIPCGVRAVEALRILSGIPRFGADIHEKSLAQETGQMRALNFNKGCYLGQEIVERIRSRATVHRQIRSFSLQVEPGAKLPGPGTLLYSPDKPDTAVGELSSITDLYPPAAEGAYAAYALGTVRVEATNASLTFEGGMVTALPHAPLLPV